MLLWNEITLRLYFEKKRKERGKEHTYATMKIDNYICFNISMNVSLCEKTFVGYGLFNSDCIKKETIS